MPTDAAPSPDFDARADVSGGERLTLGEWKGRIGLGFDDMTLVPIDVAESSVDAVR
jgi:hypothetical protein